MVVVAGGVTRAGEHLFRPLRAEVRRRAFKHAEEACQIVPGALEGTAGVVGAAGVFRRERLAGA
jgi:glucokinase